MTFNNSNAKGKKSPDVKFKGPILAEIYPIILRVAEEDHAKQNLTFVHYSVCHLMYCAQFSVLDLHHIID